MNTGTKTNIPFLNIFISFLYILLTSALLYILKLSCKPLTKHTSPSSQKHQSSENKQEEVQYNKIMFVSWVKKYTIIGSYFMRDRKYMLKQLFICSCYIVACLGINRILLWPVALAAFLVPAIYVIYELILKKRDSMTIE